MKSKRVFVCAGIYDDGDGSSIVTFGFVGYTVSIGLYSCIIVIICVFPYNWCTFSSSRSSLSPLSVIRNCFTKRAIWLSNSPFPVTHFCSDNTSRCMLPFVRNRICPRAKQRRNDHKIEETLHRLPRHRTGHCVGHFRTLVRSQFSVPAGNVTASMDSVPISAA